MAKKMSWVKWSPADFLNGVIGLNKAEGWLYTVVLNLIYDHGGPIEYNPQALATRCKMRSAEVEKNIAALVDTHGKLILENGLLSNRRAKAVIDEIKLLSDKNKHAAKKRWNLEGTKANKINDPAMHPHSDRNATAMPIRKDIEEENTNLTTNKKDNKKPTARVARVHTRPETPQGLETWKAAELDYLDAADRVVAGVYGRRPTLEAGQTFPQAAWRSAERCKWSLCEPWEIADWINDAVYQRKQRGEPEPSWPWLVAVVEGALKARGVLYDAPPQRVSADTSAFIAEYERLSAAGVPRSEWPKALLQWLADGIKARRRASERAG